MKRTYHLQIKAFAVLILCVAISSLNAQQFQRVYDIPFYKNGALLPNALAGGLNSCQISRIDVNMDGKKDLFLFDKTSSRFSIYLNMDDTPGAINYRYTADYNHLFPQGLRNWVLMRDLNCDGKEDILYNSGGSFRAYWNTSETSLSFSPNSTSSFQATYEQIAGNPFTANVYSVAPDISVFEDIDDDGDVDIITWTENGRTLYLYVNMAVEDGDCSTPRFVCKGMCYGMLSEATDANNITIGPAAYCFTDVIDPRSSDELDNVDATDMHVGGTLMLVDLDQNGKKDLVIGDVGYTKLIAVKMGTSSTGRDSATTVIHDFPAMFSNTEAVDLHDFPAAYYLDIDNDGIKDMLASSNSYSDAEDRQSMWLYLNRGENDLPDFELIQYDFLQEQQIDLGSGAFPVVFDLDNDGKKDLLISNLKYYDGLNSYTGQIHYYKNTGSETNPSFELADDNWLDIPSRGWRSPYPAFGDLNGDGLDDLIIGDQDGTLHLFTNTAQAGEPASFVLQEESLKASNGSTIDVGQFSVPQILDLNDDGLNDLIIGEYNGNINYYQNIGSTSVHSFEHRADTLGAVLASSILGIQGKCVPHFFKNNQGEWELLVGSETGEINHYNHISGNLEGSFNLVTPAFESIKDGERASVFLADITGDGLKELFVGNMSGGIAIYKGLYVQVDELRLQSLFKLFPNPAQNLLYFSCSELGHSKAVATVFDITGRKIKSVAIEFGEGELNVSKLPAGVYFLQIESDKLNGCERFVIQR